MGKVAILGIDGGSLELIERWKDELPNFRRIMENGVYGELESTLPPVTCPAWPCMFTGKNPGKLGIYGFATARPDKEYKLQFSSSIDYHSSSLWKILNDYGKDVGLMRDADEVAAFAVAAHYIARCNDNVEAHFDSRVQFGGVNHTADTEQEGFFSRCGGLQLDQLSHCLANDAFIVVTMSCGQVM